MTRSSRPRLRSEISRGHLPEYQDEGTSARTRPFSYDEIMRRRKTKKQVDVVREEARETEHTRYEESVKNPDHHSGDANAVAVKYTKNHAQEADSRTKEDKSYKTEDTLNMSKNKAALDSEHKYEKNLRNGVDAVKASRGGHLSSKLDEGNQRIDSRSMHKHDKDVKNGSEAVKSDRRGHVSGRTYKEGHDMIVESKEKYENIAKNRTPLLKAGWRDNVRDYMDEENHDMGSRSKYGREKYGNADTELPKTIKREHHSGRLDEQRHDMNAGFKDRHEKFLRNSKSLKDDRRESLRDRHGEESHDVGSRSKNKYEKETWKSSEGLDSYRHGHVRVKQGEVLRDAVKYDTDDKHHRDTVAQKRYIERSSGASESERKRKDRSAGDEKYRHKDSVKRHDSGHRLDSKLSERKEKIESSQLRHDETRSKRRRSRSLDRSKDQGRRARSTSPMARKITLTPDHEHKPDQDNGPLPSHPQKEKSSQNSDVDRSNTAGNGSISHRRHSGFSSGLGGYSPRKRKTDAAIKTPSPIRSPERKSAGWDLPSSRGERNLSASVAPGTQPLSLAMSSNKTDLAIGTSVASSMGMPLSKILLHGLSTFKEASVDSVQLTQATRPMRRLYIDNIPASASEKEIMESFNTHLLSSGSNHIRGTHPCISCMINKEKGQALLEFLTPEDASAALSFDGRSLYGSVLKIRRPKDYTEMTSGSAERLKAGASKTNAINDVTASDVQKDVAISDVVKDSPHKIFVGGIAEGLSSEMVMEIFSALGPLKAFRFKINKDLNEPCVFLEYTDQAITSKACAALNGMKLGGRILTVAQAIPDTSFKGRFETRPFYGIPEHVKRLLEKPTLVLKLSNVLDQKAVELIPETDLEEIMEDVRLECSRFGSVVSINVVMTNNMQTTDLKVEVVNDGESPFQSHGEREPSDDLNMDLLQVAINHDGGECNDGQPLTNVEELNKVDNVEGVEVETSMTARAVQVEASMISALNVEEADTSAIQECDNVASDDRQQCIGPDDTAIENAGNVTESDGNHREAIGDMVQLGDGETCQADAVEQLDSATVKHREKTLVSNESEITSKVGNNFEVGCILVEFKRTEASCMAAHCLHGRLFDDRTVTVEYVPHEAYLARFPK
ncbi:hypothetical protein vseg_001119 [Gypsophila vaccaria]